jgi:hypothetical protein
VTPRHPPRGNSLERKMMVNNSNNKQRPRGAAAIASRMAKLDNTGRCTVPDCHRASMVSASQGLADTLCKFHIQRRARHGSAFAPSLSAKDLRPYTVTATQWIKQNRSDSFVGYPLMGLRGLLDGAGAVVPPIGLKHRSATQKARAALARLRDKGITPDKILATYIAVSVLLTDDAYAPRNDERYRLTQIAKPLRRLASGHHVRGEYPGAEGNSIVSFEEHSYAPSSGLALVALGKAIDELCHGWVRIGASGGAIEAVRAAKLAKFGAHPPRLPGYQPPWKLAREKMMRQQAQATAVANNQPQPPKG